MWFSGDVRSVWLGLEHFICSGCNLHLVDVLEEIDICRRVLLQRAARQQVVLDKPAGQDDGRVEQQEQLEVAPRALPPVVVAAPSSPRVCYRM